MLPTQYKFPFSLISGLLDLLASIQNIVLVMNEVINNMRRYNSINGDTCASNGPSNSPINNVSVNNRIIKITSNMIP